MKKVLLAASAVALTFAVACKKSKTTDQNGGGSGSTPVVVAEVQRGFVGYVGASWCPPCGAYGGPAYKKMGDMYTKDKMVSFYLAPSGNTVAHYPGNNDTMWVAGFVNDIYTAMKSSGTIPFFNVNGANVGGAYTDANYTATTYGGKMNSITGNTPMIAVGAKKTLTGNKLSCEVKVKAVKEWSGELYYSVIATETKAIGIQKISGLPDDINYEHHNIARASLVGNGKMSGQKGFELFNSGTATAGKEFTKSFSLDFTPYVVGKYDLVQWNYNPSNTNIVVTVWTKVGGVYSYVNGAIAD